MRKETARSLNNAHRVATGGGAAFKVAMSVLSEKEALRRSRAPSMSSMRHLNCWGCGLSDVSVLTAAEDLEVLNLRLAI